MAGQTRWYALAPDLQAVAVLSLFSFVGSILDELHVRRTVLAVLFCRSSRSVSKAHWVRTNRICIAR